MFFTLNVSDVSLTTSRLKFIAHYERERINDFGERTIYITARELTAQDVIKYGKVCSKFAVSYIACTLRIFECKALGISLLVSLDEDPAVIQAKLLGMIDFETLSEYLERMEKWESQ